MQYNLAQLLTEPTGSARNYEVDESFIGPEDGMDRVQGWIEVVRTHQGVIVHAKLEAQVRLTCSRCVRVFENSSIIKMEEESSPTVDPVTGKQLETLEESDSELELDDQHVLDMEEVVRQYLLTGMPIKGHSRMCR